MKYYFISYAYKRNGSIDWEFCEETCEGSAIAHFAKIKQTYEDGSYRLISYNEMTKEEYEEFGGWFG